MSKWGSDWGSDWVSKWGSDWGRLEAFWLGFRFYKTGEIKIINHRNGDLI